MKDTFYFPHDYNARSDPKLQDVLVAHGVAGLGIYWCIIEQLYEQGGLLPLCSCKTIAFALHVESKIVESIVNDFDLFENDGENFWSNSAKKRLDKRSDISEKRKSAAVKRWKSMPLQQGQCLCNANAMQSDANKRKEKEIKVKENKKEINKEKDLPAADAPVSGAYAPDPPESETKTDFKSLMAFVNAEFAKGKSTMPRLRTIDGTRRTHTLARIREHGEEALREVVRKAVASDFLNGNNSRGWAATFDWLVLPNNFIKVLEGNYDNDRHNKQNGKFNAGLDPRFNFETDGRDAKAELYPDVL